MVIKDNQYYQVTKHNGEIATMKGDALRNYLIIFRDLINVEFTEEKPAPKKTKSPKKEIDFETNLN